MSYVWFLFAGALFCNGVPHLAAGLRGEAFPTPFAKPPGRGPSPPWLNVLWGTVNLLVGASLVRRGMGLPFSLELLALAAGFVLAGVPLGWHFGRVRAGRQD